MNAFRINHDQILLVTKFRSIVFDEELNKIHESQFKQFDADMERLYCFNLGKSGYLLGCDLYESVATNKSCTHTYRKERNEPGSNSWLVRCTLDPKTHEFGCSEKEKENSLLLHDEQIYNVLEFGKDNMLISLALTNLLVINQWEPVRLIQKNSPGNIMKNYFALMPGFDE